MSANLLSLLPLLLSAALGWLARHYQLLGSNPAPATQATPSTLLNQKHVELLQLLTGKAKEEAESLLLSAAQAAIRKVILDAQQAAQQGSQPSAPAKP